MTCAACQARVQRALTKTPGVDEAAVNLMMNNAAVTYDPAVASPELLVDAIRATGYGAELPAAEGARAEQRRAGRDAARRIPRSPQQSRVRFRRRRRRRWRHRCQGRRCPRCVGEPGAAVARRVVAHAGRDVRRDGVGGTGFLRARVEALRHGSADMNTLISVGTGAAFVFSLVATVRPPLLAHNGVQPHVYYEAVVFIIAFVLAGRAMEARAKSQTTSALRRLVDLQPPTRARDARRRRARRADRARAARRCRRRAAGRARCRSTARSSTAPARSTNRC